MVKCKAIHYLTRGRALLLLPRYLMEKTKNNVNYDGLDIGNK